MTVVVVIVVALIVVALIVVALIVWCVVSVIAAVVFGRVVARAARDARFQQRDFERHSNPQTRTAA